MKKCDICGKSFKNVSSHKRWAHEGKRPNSESSFIELSRLRGEVGRLEDLKRADPERWSDVFHAYVKSRTGRGDTRSQRQQLRREIVARRIQERW